MKLDLIILNFLKLFVIIKNHKICISVYKKYDNTELNIVILLILDAQYVFHTEKPKICRRTEPASFLYCL